MANAKYRGYYVNYCTYGVDIHTGDDVVIESHNCANDDATKRYTAMKAIDNLLRKEKEEQDANIQRVDAEVKLARNNGY